MTDEKKKVPAFIKRKKKTEAKEKQWLVLNPGDVIEKSDDEECEGDQDWNLVWTPISHDDD